MTLAPSTDIVESSARGARGHKALGVIVRDHGWGVGFCRAAFVPLAVGLGDVPFANERPWCSRQLLRASVAMVGTEWFKLQPKLPSFGSRSGYAPVRKDAREGEQSG